MSEHTPTKHILREALLLYYHQKKNATESYRLLSETYPGHAPTERTCRRWFERFEKGDYELTDRERPGQPKKINDAKLEALLKEDPSRTLKELAELLNVDLSTVGKRLKSKGMKRIRGKKSANQ